MTNTNKKSKNTRKLLGAVGMLSVSAAMLVSSTFAWFTMNKTVKATNMQVKAKADQGLLINEIADHTNQYWDEEATTSQNEGILLHATSTHETSTWFAAYSKKSNDAAAATASGSSANLTEDGYKTLGNDGFTVTTETVAAVAGSNAQQEITYKDFDGDSVYDNGEGYYVKYTYYLKSSGDELSLGLADGEQSLNIANVTVTGNGSGTSGAANLDKALRVAVVVNNRAYIYAPLYDSAQTYYVGDSHTATTTLTGTQPTSLASIPSVTNDGTAVYVYLYFEGEDSNLKTENATSALDNLTVSLNFTLVENSGAATDNGVSIS